MDAIIQGSVGHRRMLDSNRRATRAALSATGVTLITLAVLPTSSPASPATASAVQSIAVQEMLVVSLGDSYSSGEGNPDRRYTLTSPAEWGGTREERKCHRSARAWPAQVARTLEARDPTTFVTFVHLACSGAKITGRPGDGGILTSYSGVEKDGPVLEPQVEDLARLVRRRPIDVLLVTAGGNDIGFANIVKDCQLRPDCHRRPSITNRVRARLRDLPARFDALSAELARFHPRRVIMLAYPDPSSDEQGRWRRFPGFLRGINGAEARWASIHVVSRLNDVIAEASSRHGWTFVGDTEQEFVRHGYSAAPRERWIRTAEESAQLQGPPCGLFCGLPEVALTKGTLHPNAAGQVAMRNAALRALIPTPPPPPPYCPGSRGGPAQGRWVFLVGHYASGRPDVFALKAQGGGGTTEVHVLSRADRFCRFARQTPTALHETDTNWAFALGDYDNDGGRLDIYAIQRMGARSTEVHVLHGRADYGAFRRQVGTALHRTDANWEFAVGDYDGDGGRPDLYGIQTRGAASTELHVLRGATEYATFRRQTATALHRTDPSWEFALGDYDGDGGRPDLFAIKPRGAVSTELHILSGKHEYQRFRRQVGTVLHPTDGSWAFGLGDYDGEGGRPDLFAVRKRTGHGTTEVHVLSGASDYQRFLAQLPTVLHETEL
jgi:hypothetical protein